MEFPGIDGDLEALMKNKCSSNDGKTVMGPFLVLFKAFLTSLNLSFETFKDEMMNILESKDLKINKLDNEVNTLRNRIATLEERLDAQDQYVRRETLIFSGDQIPVTTDQEDSATVICQLINDKLNANDVHISPTDISVAHRLGSKPANGVDDRRSIIAKFVRRNQKRTILLAARKAKPNGFFVNESLTPTRQKIAFALRKANKKFPSKITAPSTFDGSISVGVLPANTSVRSTPIPRVTINSMDKLFDFCQKTFQADATKFLPRPSAAQAHT